VIIVICLLLFLVFFWFLALSSILGGLSFLSSFLLLFLLFNFLRGFWSFLDILQFSLADWLFWLWKACCHLEHLTSSFTVRGRDDWRMNVKKSSLLEELVCSISQVVSHPYYRTKSVGSRTQMSLLSKNFWLWTTLNWISTIAMPNYLGIMLLGVCH